MSPENILHIFRKCARGSYTRRAVAQSTVSPGQDRNVTQPVKRPTARIEFFFSSSHQCFCRMPHRPQSSTTTSETIQPGWVTWKGGGEGWTSSCGSCLRMNLLRGPFLYCFVFTVPTTIHAKGTSVFAAAATGVTGKKRKVQKHHALHAHTCGYPPESPPRVYGAAAEHEQVLGPRGNTIAPATAAAAALDRQHRPAHHFRVFV